MVYHVILKDRVMNSCSLVKVLIGDLDTSSPSHENSFAGMPPLVPCAILQTMSFNAQSAFLLSTFFTKICRSLKTPVHSIDQRTHYPRLCSSSIYANRLHASHISSHRFQTFYDNCGLELRVSAPVSKFLSLYNNL